MIARALTWEQPDWRRLGWIANGGIGCLDEAGYLCLCDRAKDMIVAGGVNVFPAEIEALILRYPNLRGCAVFGIPDEAFGEAMTVPPRCSRREAIGATVPLLPL